MTENTIETPQQLEAFDSIQSILNQSLAEKYVKAHAKQNHEGVNSGFFELDNITNGFHKGELTTVVVRPGVGKTAFLLSLVSNVAVTGDYSAGIISCRRPANQIVARLIASSTGLSLNKINNGDLTDFEENKVNIALNNLYKSNLYIEDQSNPTLNEVMENVRKMAAGGMDIVFIDFLEKIINTSSDEECENDDICVIMKSLHALAKEVDIPLVLFSELKQPVLYKNKYKYTPDSINENTDSLIFLNRPDYYHINAIDKKEKGIAELTIAKHINIGEMQMISLKIVESLDKYVNLN